MTDAVKTILQITNAPLHPSALRDSVLLIIDAQEEYVSGKLRLDGIEAAIAEARAVLDLARTNGVPVIHIVQHSPPGRGVFEMDTPMVDIVPPLTPAAGEDVIPKRLANSFAGTTLKARLDEIFQETGRRELILTGFMTHQCVSSTARAAFDFGIRTTVVAAATGTRTLPDPIDGGVIAARTLHHAALAELTDRFSIVVRRAADLPL